jgi:hypothetical protein
MLTSKLQLHVFLFNSKFKITFKAKNYSKHKKKSDKLFCVNFHLINLLCQHRLKLLLYSKNYTYIILCKLWREKANSCALSDL